MRVNLGELNDDFSSLVFAQEVVRIHTAINPLLPESHNSGDVLDQIRLILSEGETQSGKTLTKQMVKDYLIAEQNYRNLVVGTEGSNPPPSDEELREIDAAERVYSQALRTLREVISD